MTPISFFAQGEPKAMGRPRAFAANIGGKMQARVYNPKSAEAWKSQIAEAAKPFLVEMLMEPVAVSLIFIFPRPKSHYRTGKHAGQLRDDAPLFHSVKPDCDNLAKAVWDALKTIGLLADDCRIVHAEITKIYAVKGLTGCDIEIKPPSNAVVSALKQIL